MVQCPFEIETSWREALKDELQKPYLFELALFLERERASEKRVFPPKQLVFNAFNKTPFDRVRVVLVGQDPYHGAGQAHGLSFSVPEGVPLPPSLKNIFKEIGGEMPPHGCLSSWAEQGVLLLNSALTVREGTPNSHKDRGWERFTDAVIQKLAERKKPLIFVLWGNSAKEKCERVLNQYPHHVCLTAAHPSPFSAHKGFLGCGHFSKINEQLKPPIEWSLGIHKE